MNLLITSAGRRVSLLRQFEYELKNYFPEGKVYTGDSNPKLSPACQASVKAIKLPLASDIKYIDTLKSICIQEEISLVIPTIDTELSILSKNKDLFLEHGIQLLVSDLYLIEKCEDKRLTHQLFKKLRINVPELLDKNNPEFPLFIKPYDGSSSTDIYFIEKKENLTKFHLENRKLLFFEYLDHNKHTEFTIDLYYDKHSKLRCLVPRERIEVRDGEVSKGVTRKNKLMKYLKKRLDTLEGAIGCITLQTFVNNDTKEVFGIEINPRFGGGYPLSYQAGANFPKWVIEEYLAKKEAQDYEKWENNLLMLRYDEVIMVHDFEDQ